MAEVIGLIASIATITAAARQGLKVIINLHQAPDELKSLQVRANC